MQPLKAQIQTELVPLISIIEQLETRYNVSFSFLNTTLLNIESSVPPENVTLKEALTILKEQTGLIFKVIDRKSIVIQKPVTVLMPQIEQLHTVIIQHYLTKGINLNADGTIKITPKDFDILPGLIEPDVMQTIKALPGITSTDETIANLNIRGGTNDQNLILWDGIKMYQSGHFFGMISAFDPYAIASVSVTKNGTSARFGDGVSGTVQMELSDAVNNKNTGGAGFNLLHGNGYLKFPLSEKMGLQISARRSITDVFNTVTYNQYFDRVFQDTDVTNNSANYNRTITKNEEFYFYDVSTKLIYDVTKKDKIQGSFLTIDNRLNYLEEATISDFPEALESGLSQKNVSGKLKYNRVWNSIFTTSISGYVSSYMLRAKNFDVINNQQILQENEVLDTGIKIEINNIISPTIQWINGYQFAEVGMSNLEDVNRPDFKRYIKEVIRSHAGFSEFEYAKRNTNIRGGLRVTHYRKFEEAFIEPRISASQKFAKNFRIELLGELKHQASTQIIDRQNDFLGIEKRRWVLANDSTVPIVYSRQVSLGLHYKKNTWLLSAEGYVKDVEGISSRSQGFQNQFQFTNTTGGYTINGLDFLAHKKWGNFKSWMSYSVNRNEYRFESLNNGFKFPNNVAIQHAVNFTTNYTYNKLALAIGFNWHSGLPTTAIANEENGTINYTTPNGDLLDNYFRADISATYKLTISPKLNSIIGLSLWNVLNHNNILNRYYTNDNDKIQVFEESSLGFTPNLSVRVSF
ncbi:hypothetical protein ULMS_04140 [Patiriisocius marinistellae]|uniref:Uncharacterized protein n=1 Tax=Patiriisocius marinistellae TaxID=2494560 RepID=A0A5J4FXN0_9FLAO|nr:TonB-dependent receptor plug domain-containing protein [Patiriisocius marinistellae]GEQ84906.1 hypothetical protein ULMS_04140 [Patiriisocius marinistellae]